MTRTVDTLTTVELVRQRRWNLSGKGQSEFMLSSSNSTPIKLFFVWQGHKGPGS